MQTHRAAHIEFCMKQPPLRLAMQLKFPEREVIGSIIIVETPTLADAESLAQADLYVAGGVFSIASVRTVEVRFCNLNAGPP